jgi:SAM-dependent methyltransferase
MRDPDKQHEVLMSQNATIASHPVPDDFFTRAWAIYRLCVDQDYLWHGLLGQTLTRVLDSHFPADKPLRFLDLACGDASTTGKVLQGRPLSTYVGVDRSAVALGLAATNLAGLSAPVRLIEDDFVEYVQQSRETFDLIYLGLSAHHLDEPGLTRLFACVRSRLAEGGLFTAYEPFTLPDETHAEHFARFYEILNRDYTAMTPEQRAEVAQHVGTQDFPRTVSRWDELTAAAGFLPAQRVMKSPDRLYEMLAYQPRSVGA